jgi:hypothetical protein
VPETRYLRPFDITASIAKLDELVAMAPPAGPHERIIRSDRGEAAPPAGPPPDPVRTGTFASILPAGPVKVIRPNVAYLQGGQGLPWIVYVKGELSEREFLCLEAHILGPSKTKVQAGTAGCFGRPYSAWVETTAGVALTLPITAAPGKVLDDSKKQAAIDAYVKVLLRDAVSEGMEGMVKTLPDGADLAYIDLKHAILHGRDFSLIQLRTPQTAENEALYRMYLAGDDARLRDHFTPEQAAAALAQPYLECNICFKRFPADHPGRCDRCVNGQFTRRPGLQFGEEPRRDVDSVGGGQINGLVVAPPIAGVNPIDELTGFNAGEWETLPEPYVEVLDVAEYAELAADAMIAGRERIIRETQAAAADAATVADVGIAQAAACAQLAMQAEEEPAAADEPKLIGRVL